MNLLDKAAEFVLVTLVSLVRFLDCFLELYADAETAKTLR